MKNCLAFSLWILSSLILICNVAQAEGLVRRTFLDKNFAVSKGKVKVAFFDADSTLRVSLSGSPSANFPTDVAILPFVSDKVAELGQRGYFVAVVSNQGGVASGHVTLETADSALHCAVQLIRAENPKAIIHYFDFAEAKDDFRKPNTGMAKLLNRKLKTLKTRKYPRGLSIDFKNSFMVGDSAYKKGVDIGPDGPGTHFSNSDRLFAENLKIPFFEPKHFFNWVGIDVFSRIEQVNAFREKMGLESPKFTAEEVCIQN